MEKVKMENVTWPRKKGGRPRKELKKDCFIGVRCTLDEKKLIKSKAREMNQGSGEYLRNLGLNRQIDIRNKAMPAEVLQVIGTLNHLAANINQLAKRLNSTQTLRVFETVRLSILTDEVGELTSLIKSYFK